MASTILVVEDEDTLRETLAYQLEQDGYRVVAAADGGAALTQFRAAKPDLVLLDLMLPELSGMEVARILRRESDVPILMLTARGSEIDKVVGLEVGADDYVTKPFSLRELQARIRGLLRRRERALGVGPADSAAELVTIGRVEVDLPGHRLLRDGEVRSIKPKAFDLLAFLLHHPGQVFSREQLLADVWGYDYAGETRTVDVHVHWLRSEIEPDPRHPTVIETVRGAGYVLRGK
ncbi:MAG: response regulator [Chloroflexota bacterium]